MRTETLSFDALVAELERIGQITGTVNPVLTRIDARIKDVESVTSKVHGLVHDVDICCKLIANLGKVARALSPLPVIGEVAGMFATVLGNASYLAKGIDKALNEVDGSG